MKRYDIEILGELTGLPVVGATFEVYVSAVDPTANGTVLATLFGIDDLSSQPIANPITNTILQSYFYAPDGLYDLVARQGSNVARVNRQELIDFFLLKEDLQRQYDAVLQAVEESNAAIILDAVNRAETAAAAADTDALATAANLSAAQNIVTTLPVRTTKLMDSSIVSSTTLVADPELSVAIGVNAFMTIEGVLNYTTGATGDFKLRYAGPAGAASVLIKQKTIAPGDTAQSVATPLTAYSASDIVVAAGAGAGQVAFTATIRNGATAGNFTILRAQNASDTTPTVLQAGSYIEARTHPTYREFAFSNAAIAKLGQYNVGGAPLAGRNFIKMAGGLLNPYIDTEVYGTAAQVPIFFGSGTYRVSVDFGPLSAPLTGTTGWGDATLFTGLAEGWHRVQVYCSQGYFDANATIRVFGLNPDIRRPSDLPTYYQLKDPANSPYIAVEATYGTTTYADAPYATVYWGADGFGARFRATTTTVRAFMFCNGATVVLYQDGVQIGGSIVLPNTGTFQVVTLATGVSGTHDYEPKNIGVGKLMYIDGFLLDTLSATAQTAKSAIAFYGDSNTTMSVIGGDARLGDAYLTAVALGRCAIRIGLGGTGVSVNESGNQSIKYGRANTATVTGLPGAIDTIVNCHVTNDIFFNVPVATFKTDYKAMVATQRAAKPLAKIACRGPLPHARSPQGVTPALSQAAIDALTAQFGTAMAEAVAEAGDANIVFIDMAGVINTSTDATTGDLSDTVHLRARGFAKLPARQQASM